MTSEKNRIDEAVLLRAAIELAIIFSGRAEKIIVFRDLNLEVARGRWSPSRASLEAGKSTLLHLLGGLDRPTWGA